MTVISEEVARATSVNAADEDKSMRRVVMASVIGTTVEWYDFLLYGTAAALVFNRLFFPAFDPLMGTLAALASFAVGFIARPLGGVIFGHFGDRIGRKSMLMLTMFLMGGGTFAIGLLPTYEQIGIWAPIALVVLRIIQGLSVGGEWGGAALMVIEHSSDKRRGYFGSLVQVGFPLGLLASTGMLTWMSLMPDEQFLSWGWRVPFLVSIVLVAIGFYIRMKVVESPIFEASQQSNETKKEKAPFFQILSEHRKNLALSIGLKVCEVAWVYILTVFVIVYGTNTLGVPKDVILNGVLLGAALEIGFIPFFGWLSDKVGRRTLYYFGTAFVMLAVYPLFLSLDSQNHTLIILAIAACMVFGHGPMYGPQAAYLPELFGTRVRYSGASLGCQVAAGVGGGLAPMLATWLLAMNGHYWGVIAMVLVLCLITLWATYASPETAGGDLNNPAHLGGG